MSDATHACDFDVTKSYSAKEICFKKNYTIDELEEYMVMYEIPCSPGPRFDRDEMDFSIAGRHLVHRIEKHAIPFKDLAKHREALKKLREERKGNHG